jgi:drug/metabolite transporter (DMT)-like permease
MSEEFASVLPREKSQYLQSRQAQDDLPLEFFTTVQNWTVLASIVIIVAFLPRVWRNRSPRSIGLGVVIVSTVVANALVTGTLSMVEDRLQSRVVWLIPFLAILLILDWFEQKLASRPPARTF